MLKVARVFFKVETTIATIICIMSLAICELFSFIAFAAFYIDSSAENHAAAPYMLIIGLVAAILLIPIIILVNYFGKKAIAIIDNPTSRKQESLGIIIPAMIFASTVGGILMLAAPDSLYESRQ
ncbi:MAG: hypothetical protein MJ217_03300 [Bacilli bacterium]|nr:hypothetical protein [Bacilli bacterium]